VSATIVGSGPDEKTLHASVEAHGLTRDVHFLPAMPARQAFSLGRMIIVPSRSESLPYIVLEAAGAGLPVIATRVGGIPEIFGPDSGRLIPPENALALATTIAHALENPQEMRQFAQALRQRVRDGFSVQLMVDDVLAAYRQAVRSV
jgi:glycosyltransferase involved in cell wall biosynthesis